MKLNRALLCVECDEVFEPYPINNINGKPMHYVYSCPSCGNTQCVALAKWLKPNGNRKDKQ